MMGDLTYFIHAQMKAQIAEHGGWIVPSFRHEEESTVAYARELGCSDFGAGINKVPLSYMGLKFSHEIPDINKLVSAVVSLRIGEMQAGKQMPLFAVEADTLRFTRPAEEVQCCQKALHAQKVVRTEFNECIPRSSWLDGAGLVEMLKHRKCIENTYPNIAVHMAWMTALTEEPGLHYFHTVCLNVLPSERGQTTTQEVLDGLRDIMKSDLVTFVGAEEKQQLANIISMVISLHNGQEPAAILRSSSPFVSAASERFQFLLPEPPIPEGVASSCAAAASTEMGDIIDQWLGRAKVLEDTKGLTVEFLKQFAGWQYLFSAEKKNELKHYQQLAWSADPCKEKKTEEKGDPEESKPEEKKKTQGFEGYEFLCFGGCPGRLVQH